MTSTKTPGDNTGSAANLSNEPSNDSLARFASVPSTLGVPTTLAAIREEAEGLIALSNQLNEEIQAEVSTTGDLPGVKRVGPTAIVVSSADLFSRGVWNQFVMDGPKQAARLAQVVGKILTTPAHCAAVLGQILSDNEEKAKVDGVRYVYDARIVQKFYPILTQAVETAKVLAALQASNPQPNLSTGPRP